MLEFVDYSQLFFSAFGKLVSIVPYGAGIHVDLRRKRPSARSMRLSVYSNVCLRASYGMVCGSHLSFFCTMYVMGQTASA